jgi:pectate lyase
MKTGITVAGISIVMGVFSAWPQTQYCLSGPVGFAAGVTGGGTPTSSNIVTVSSASELTSALSGSKSVILVSGSITTSRIECSASNKSIIGLPGAKLVNLNQTQGGSGILHLKSGSNLIIRNIVFAGPGAYDEDGWDNLTNKGCTRLWVDHCEFQDGMDGNFDNTNSADNVTVSWCKFAYLKAPKAGGSGGADDHRFTNLVGGSDSDTPADGKYSITWLNCWWADGCVDRMVRARNAQIDMLNCYWNSKNASSNIHLSPGTNGTYVYVENGVFKCSGKIVNFEKTGNNNVKFVSCTGGGSNTGSVSAPTYSWSPTPADKVADMVSNAKCGAGATLKVTAAGEISSDCGATGVATEGGANRADFPQAGRDVVAGFQATGVGNAVMTVYDMAGRKALSFSCSSLPREAVGTMLRPLAPGMYRIELRDNDRVVTRKFLVKG